jgi:hypothetical protein
MAVLLAAICSPRTVSQTPAEQLLSTPLTLHFRNETFVYVLSNLSVQHRIPIGLELALVPKDDAILSINVENEPLKRVLDLIVQQEPDYRWEVSDNVINFVPTRSRDLLLEQLLETKVSRFAPKKGMDKYELRNAIADLPEVKAFLDSHNLTVFRLGPPTYRSIYSNDEVDLSISSTNVRGVLNKIIKESEHPSWVIKRRGATQSTIHLGF